MRSVLEDDVSSTDIDLVPVHSFSKKFDISTFPCVPRYDAGTKQNPDGLLFIKVPKAASSTTTAIAIRIGYRRGTGKNGTCHVEACHGGAYLRRKHYATRNKARSFLWTIVRDPTSRALSEIKHFRLTREGLPPTDDNIIKQLRKIEQPFQLQYISMRRPPRSLPQHKAYRLIQQTLKAYDFIGLAERFDESMVVLRLLMGLDPGDFIYNNAKTGLYDDTTDKQCQPMVSYKPTDTVSEFLQSDEWRNSTDGDIALIQAVNRSLDSTIDNVIGRATFQKALAEHYRLMEMVQTRCKPILPCSETGDLQLEKSKKDCLLYPGMGCGYRCMDEIAGDPPGGSELLTMRYKSTYYCRAGCRSSQLKC